MSDRIYTEEREKTEKRPEEDVREREIPTGTGEETPHRRRRADKYREEEAAEPHRPGRGLTAMEEASETAREVAQRYRQQNLASEETRRVAARPDQGGDARMAQRAGRGPSEQVGYAPGRMGMSAADRARMSEQGRARLRQESREGSAAGRPRPSLQDAPYGRDPRQSVRPIPQEERKRKSAGRRILILLLAVILVIAAAGAALLLVPDAGPLNPVKQGLHSLTGWKQTPAALAFTVSWPEGDGIPSSVDFAATTGKGVTGVRVRTAAGELTAVDWQMTEKDGENLWQGTWSPENAYSGLVTLEIESGAEWRQTEHSAQVQVSPAGPRTETPEEKLPVVFATETPSAEVTEAPPEAENTEAEPAEETEQPEETEPPEETEQPEETEPAAEEETEIPEETEAPAEEQEAGRESPDPDDPEQSGAEAVAEETPETPEENPPETAAEPEGTDGAGAAAENGEEADGETAEAPARPMLTASAGEGADPSVIASTVIYNGTKKVAEYARSDKEKIHMPVLGEYTKQKIGVLTFRTDAFRQNAAVGNVRGLNSLELAWTAEAGSVKGAGQTYYGLGWVGQPAIVKWSKQVREQSEMYDAKKEKTGLKEVIACGLDGRIYFLDLEDGTPTRNSIKLGYPMKAAPSVHPGGAPYMTVGQFARKMAGHTGTIGLRQYNLYMQKELSLIDGMDGKNNRPYNQVGSFETSALIDRTSGCMITASTNGMLYLINLNSEFDYNAGTYTQSPTTVVMKTKAKGEKDASTAVEASVAMYDHYVYYADLGGFLRCVDTNTLSTVWAVSLGDAVESTPALDWHGQTGLDLYAATLLSARKKGDAEVRCLDALTGEVRWTAAFGVKKDTKNKTVSGFRASPVVGQNGLSDYVYYTVNNLSPEGQEQLGVGESTAALVALNKSDGQVAWAAGLTGRGYSSPVAVYDKEGRGAVIQCAGDGSVRMLDGLTGRELASLEIDGAIEASPAVYDGTLVIGTSERNKNNIYGIRIE